MSDEVQVEPLDFKRIRKVVHPHYRGGTLYMPIPLAIRRELLKEAEKRGILGWLKGKLCSFSELLNRDAIEVFSKEIGRRDFPPVEINYRRGEIEFSVRILEED